MEDAANNGYALGGEAPAEFAGFVKADRERWQKVIKEAGIKLLVGARLDLACGNSLLCFPTERAAYGRLSRLLSLGRRRAPKGECELHLGDLEAFAEGQIVVALAPHAYELLPPDPPVADLAVPAVYRSRAPPHA